MTVSVQIRFGNGQRRRFTVDDETRAEALRAFARDMAAADLSPTLAADLINEAATAPDAKHFETCRRYLAEKIAEARDSKRGRVTRAVTFGDLATRWTSGALAEQYPAYVKAKRSVATDVSRFKLINEVVGSVPLKDFKLAHAKAVLAALPKDLSDKTVREYATLVSKVLRWAVFPCELIETYPLPENFTPKPSKPPALSYLYPDEERRLIACSDVPVERRLFYGVLSREGMRLGEALALEWSALDLERGSVRLDVSKTDVPRTWALDESVVRALRVWRSHAPRGRAQVFNPGVGTEHYAKRFRADLRLAGVTRSELFERSDVRRPIRIHDTRAGFATLALAAGKTETWVCDRAGWTSSQMVARYRRLARHAGELGLGRYLPLDEALGWHVDGTE